MIGLFVLASLLPEMLQNSLGDNVAEFGHECSILIVLSADIQGNVLAIYDTLHKPKEVR